MAETEDSINNASINEVGSHFLPISQQPESKHDIAFDDMLFGGVNPVEHEVQHLDVNDERHKLFMVADRGSKP